MKKLFSTLTVCGVLCCGLANANEIDWDIRRYVISKSDDLQVVLLNDRVNDIYKRIQKTKDNGLLWKEWKSAVKDLDLRLAAYNDDYKAFVLEMYGPSTKFSKPPKRVDVPAGDRWNAVHDSDDQEIKDLYQKAKDLQKKAVAIENKEEQSQVWKQWRFVISKVDNKLAVQNPDYNAKLFPKQW